jgi:hypothetical protein
MKALRNLILTSIVSLTCLASAAEPTAVVKASQELRIPKVEFRDATLGEAIAFLSKKSIEVDPQKKGINIAFAGTAKPDATITLSVNDASVYDIVTVVAGQVGMQIEPTETILMLVSKAQ